MSSVPPADEAPAAGPEIDPAATAARLRDAEFVALVAQPDGDALAGAGLLAAALRATGVPFRASVRTGAPARSDGTVVRLGGRSREGDGDETGVRLPGDGSPASVAAHAVAAELDGAPAATLALAGAVAGGATPGADGTASLLESARRAGAVERRPGLAVPVADLGDGVAHTTLVHGPFSGDPDRARDRLALDGRDGEPDESERRRVASLVAVAAATAPDAPPSAAEAVERALRPHATPDGPFATLGGWADVLRAAARERPGAGVALALGAGAAGYDPRTTALSAWRAHGRAVHGLIAGIDDATTGRYDGLFVVRAGETSPGRARTAARLIRDFRSPEPTALVVGEGAVAAAATDRRTRDAVAEALAATAGGDDGQRAAVAVGGDRTAAAALAGDGRETIAAAREATG